ncbi:MAG TPA: DUF3833 family protein [Allosphingosinicella sp.]
MILLPLLLALQVAAAPVPGPEHFFVGRTEGVGTVRVMLSGSHGVRDHNRGRIDANGTLLLEQVIEEDGKPPRRRSWRLVRNGPNRFTGTISDAVGPVTGEATGNVMHLRYRSVEGVNVEQWITLHPGGRTAHNRMTFRRFGFNVATLEGIVRRVD